MKNYHLKEPSWWKDKAIQNMVPISFLVLSLFLAPFSGFSLEYLLRELILRISRNGFLVLALLLPILAGMGLNFGMILGAMCGQIALIFIIDWRIEGLYGIFLAMILSTPLSILVGIFCGRVLNRAKGREMVTGYILGFFSTGVYQLIGLFLMGKLIPMSNQAILLTRGYGVRSTVDLITLRQRVENVWGLKIGNLNIPLFSFFLIALLAFWIYWFSRTKLGQDMRAVGQDPKVSQAMGIDVDRVRVISIILSTIFSGWGMILYLQNIGTLNTYNSHEQVGLFSIAALLVGGGSVSKAKISHVFIGLILFHTMFIMSPTAGKTLLQDAALGEYFRVFISYGVITVSLIFYSIQRGREKDQEGLALQRALEENHVN